MAMEHGPFEDVFPIVLMGIFQLQLCDRLPEGIVCGCLTATSWIPAYPKKSQSRNQVSIVDPLDMPLKELGALSQPNGQPIVTLRKVVTYPDAQCMAYLTTSGYFSW